MPAPVNVAAASRASATFSPGMKRRTARRANDRRRNCSASQALREARSRILRASDMTLKI
jgi:hypothetical protein